MHAPTDVYALGCVLYEMIGGRAPFEAATPQALLAQVAVADPPSLRTSAPEIPPYVERAVERAMAKDPADRFPTAAAFADALLTGTVVAGPRRRRRRVPATVAAAGASSVLATWELMAALGGPRPAHLG